MLVFGCRNAAKDFYYQDQWEQLTAAGVLAQKTGLACAFSRDKASKVYVQHKLREHSQAVWGMMQRGAHIYVSGSANKMPQQVGSALEDVIMEHAGVSRESAQQTLKRMDASGQYVVEAWS